MPDAVLLCQPPVWIEGGFVLENSPHDHDEFTLAGDDGGLFRDHSPGQFLVERLDDWIVFDGGNGGHIEPFSQMGVACFAHPGDG